MPSMLIYPGIKITNRNALDPPSAPVVQQSYTVWSSFALVSVTEDDNRVAGVGSVSLNMETT